MVADYRISFFPVGDSMPLAVTVVVNRLAGIEPLLDNLTNVNLAERPMQQIQARRCRGSGSLNPLRVRLLSVRVISHTLQAYRRLLHSLERLPMHHEVS